MALLIEQVMTLFPHSVGIDQPLTVARQMMHEYGVRHLPVQDGGRLVGILSERDIQFALRDEQASEETITVDLAYTPEPFSTAPETPLTTVAERMAREGLGCALIVKEGKLVGIFTTVDACRTLAEVLRQHGEA